MRNAFAALRSAVFGFAGASRAAMRSSKNPAGTVVVDSCSRKIRSAFASAAERAPERAASVCGRRQARRIGPHGRIDVDWPETELTCRPRGLTSAPADLNIDAILEDAEVAAEVFYGKPSHRGGIAAPAAECDRMWRFRHIDPTEKVTQNIQGPCGHTKTPSVPETSCRITRPLGT